jgi:predicted O-methyltransferase YrrM
MNKKNVIWWTGITNPDHNDKYGGFEFFEYSRKSWEFWCKRNDCEFVAFTEPVEPDLKRFRVNWQKAIFVFDELDRRGIAYDQICLVDSSSIIKWNAPNFFDLTDRQFCGLRDTDNMNWTHQSISGYEKFFNFKLDTTKYINSGFIIFNEMHKDIFIKFKEMYYDNIDELCNLQDSIVKKGTEQTPLNYWLQMQGVDIKTDLPLPFKLTHLHRKDMFNHNWQLNEDKTPFFIKYGYIWFFNGIPKNDRSALMKNVWDLIKNNYDDKYSNVTELLDGVQHKDTAKYTTSRKFKKDIIDIFHNDQYKNTTILELGTSQGQSTKLLSKIFKHVYTVEWNDWNLEQAKLRCEGCDNITFIKADLYNESWQLPKADVVFIDAGHEYHHVISDINNSLKHLDNPIFIFDDYGLPPGEVRKAILEKVEDGSLKLNKFIGESAEDLVHAGGTKFIDKEGCICNLR